MGKLGSVQITRRKGASAEEQIRRVFGCTLVPRSAVLPRAKRRALETRFDRRCSWCCCTKVGQGQDGIRLPYHRPR